MSTPINPVLEVARAGRYPARHFNKREDKLLQSATTYTPANPSQFVVQPTTTQGGLDQLAAQSSGGVAKTVKVTYDFSVNGGAVGTIDLGTAVPANAIVETVTTDVQVPLTSGGAGTLQLNVPTDGNLAPALTTASSGQIWEDATTAGTQLLKKMTATRELQATIGTAALTAGKVTWFIRYVQSA